MNFSEKLILSLLTVPAILLTNVVEVKAWPRRQTYRISPITQQDMNSHCYDRHGHDGAYSIVAERLPGNGLEFGCRLHYNLEYSDNRGYSRNNGSFSSPNYSYDGNNSRSYNRQRVAQGEDLQIHEFNHLCVDKHRGRNGISYGAFVGDGGHSCYDSYYRWRR